MEGKKISELGKKEKQNMEDFLETKATEIGLSMYSSGGEEISRSLENEIGICCKCKHLRYAKGEFITVLAVCSSFDIRLNGRDRIVECTDYSERGRLSLQEMYAMAYLIDIDKKEIKGFGTANK
jgi:hypothetical protein